MNNQQVERLLNDIHDIRLKVNGLYWLSRCAVFILFFSHLLRYYFGDSYSFFFLTCLAYLAYIVLIVVEVCGNALLFFADNH